MARTLHDRLGPLELRSIKRIEHVEVCGASEQEAKVRIADLPKELRVSASGHVEIEALLVVREYVAVESFPGPRVVIAPLCGRLRPSRHL